MGNLLDNRLKQRAVLFPFALFAVNQLLAKRLPQFPFLTNYLNDIVALPVLLYLGLKLRNTFIQNPKPLNNVNILYTFILVSLYFEYYLPSKSPAYTSDFLDILMYGIGMFYFCLFMNGSDQKM